MSTHTFYEVMGLPESASTEDIKKRYRDLVRRFHPDVPGTGNTGRFKIIQEAYDVLSDDAQRAGYDLDLRKHAQSNGAASTGTTTQAAAGQSARPSGAASAPPPPPAGSPGDVIARKYRIVREIARSNDVVYEATDTTMGRRLAVKELVVPPNLTGQARRERIERFNREARAAGKLSHPNIVTVYDYGEDAGRYFIAMEYLEGGTLRDLIQTRGALPVNEAMDIASQVLSALSHAHSQRVVHRDVKPDNIHLLPGGQVKLTDFGIARLTEESSLTGEGQIFGTPSYMSPEQIKGHNVDHRSDIFSLGIVLYEMLAGRKPFTGDSVISITYAIMENQPAPLAGTPYSLEQVVFRALTKDPNRRYGSAEEMRRELQTADKVPPLFATGGQALGATNMGGIGGLAGASSYGGGANGGFGPFVPPGGSPFSMPLSPPIAPAGAISGSHANTVFAPPPMNAPALPPGAPGGSFVNWNPNSPNLPPGYNAPPQFPARPAGPMFSEATRTFFMVLLLAVVLGGAVLGGILLFQRAYEQQKKTGAVAAVEALNAAGKKLYESGDPQGALQKYEAAYRQGLGTKAGDDAKASLVVILHKLGMTAFERGDTRSAEDYWFRAHKLDPDNPDINYNLSKLYDRVGDKDAALREWKATQGLDRIGDSNPAAPADNSLIQSREAQAAKDYNDGMSAYTKGDVDKARELWDKAAGEAPGSDISRQARDALDKTANGPSF